LDLLHQVKENELQSTAKTTKRLLFYPTEIVENTLKKNMPQTELQLELTKIHPNSWGKKQPFGPFFCCSFLKIGGLFQPKALKTRGMAPHADAQ